MPLYQAVVLAIVQGITEFLPISSTAHLALVPWLMGWRDPGLTFDVALHLGTLAAVLVYFVRTWIRLLSQALGRRGDPKDDFSANPRLFWFLVVATIPGGVAGLALERYAESTLRSPYVIAATMIGVGLLLWWSEMKGRLQKDLDAVSLADAAAIGTAQAFAVVPGVSRSGITIAAGLFRNLERAAAAQFSFLLATPIIGGAALKAAWNIHRSGGLAPGMRTPFALGILVSAVTGYAAIAFLLRYLQARTLKFFVWYRVICGIMILALALFFRDSVMHP
ncbi:MAG TPA: undecaprenyl-diphosphatase UppP [Bryobacterales bacterium]|jgi:undecaprenyl-diphosphatase|nr:undecaprenyl-diphosphatase UppP [Bryobacterales bacterium]